MVGITTLSLSKLQSINDIIFSIFNLIGLIVSLLIYFSEVGIQSAIVKQVCNKVNHSGGCTTLLTSKSAKGIFGITPSIACLSYFVLQFLFIIGSIWFTELMTLKSLIITIAILGIPIALWSIYIQKRIEKSWCALCLTIVSVLIIQSYVSLNNPFILPLIHLSIYSISFFCIIFLFLIPIQRLLKNENKKEQVESELKKWKEDISIFNSLLHNQTVVSEIDFIEDIEIGNKNAKLKLVVACYNTPQY